MAKTAKTRIFLDTRLPFDKSKQLSQVSDQVLDKSDVLFKENDQKLIFEQKWPNFGPKKGPKMALFFF